MSDTHRLLNEVLRHAPGALAVADQAHRDLNAVVRWYFVPGRGGTGRIHGQVTVVGQPAARKVRLFDLATGMLVDETWSDAAGAYEFQHIDRARRFLVVAHDHLAQYNAAVADLIEPEAM